MNTDDKKQLASVGRIGYTAGMDFSADILTLAGLIVALAGLIITLFAWLRQDIKAQGERFDEALKAQGERFDETLKAQGQDIKAQGERFDEALKAQGERFDEALKAQGERHDKGLKALGERLDGLVNEIKALSERVSRIEGLLEGLWRPRPWPEQPPRDERPSRTGTDG